MGLLITAFLILTNMSTSTREFDASILTAMDVWFDVCRLLVAAALLEFSLLINIHSRVNMVQPQNEDVKYEIDGKCKRYDKIAFRAFSSSFALFALIYFIVYMAY